MLRAIHRRRHSIASSPRIPKAELTGVYGTMVKRMSRKMFGEVPEPVGVAWHNRTGRC